MTGPIPVTVSVRTDRVTGAYRPLWNWFGYDEPNYTYTRDGRKLLGSLAALSDSVFVRAHNLLTSGDGTAALKWGSTNAYSEDAEGNPLYDWTIMDRIFDAWVDAGLSPFVQVGFTPAALSTDPGPYRHSFRPEDRYATITTGWASPPKDLSKWGGLVEAWARHLGERYGTERVSGWPWEVWNEPDGHYWTGTIEQFCAMYDVTAAAIRRALPEARIGGPHTCGPGANANAEKFLRAFLAHALHGTNAATGGRGSILDFVGFHAKGAPRVHEGRVRMGVHKQLRDIQTGIDIIREFPELAGKSIILGESDPEGCAACSARVHPHNAYRNGPLYGVYTIEQIMRTYELARRARVEIEGAVTWAFLFADQPFFDGFRDLATNGIDKAVLNAFRMLAMLGGDWIETTSSHALSLDAVMAAGVRDAPDVNAVATRDGDEINVLVWHYHDDDVAGPAAAIELTVTGLAASSVTLSHYRMDEDHGNAYAVWQAMGSPQTLAPADRERLEKAAELALLEMRDLVVSQGVARHEFDLGRQGVSLLRFTTG
jgi:xylan 1,4-beta-xylosidase